MTLNTMKIILDDLNYSVKQLDTMGLVCDCFHSESLGSFTKFCFSVTRKDYVILDNEDISKILHYFRSNTLVKESTLDKMEFSTTSTRVTLHFVMLEDDTEMPSFEETVINDENK